MLSPEAALLVANGFCTLAPAQGAQFSQALFAAALPNFPRPSSKGETHEMIGTALPKHQTPPTAPSLALGERGDHTVRRLQEAGQGNRHQATKNKVGALLKKNTYT